jgi:predicted proteasome-type protease
VNDAAPVQQQGVDIGCHFILGGQVDGHRPRLFHIYPEGNFIEATQDTNFFQIGEHKYGKPIMDRVVKVPSPVEGGGEGDHRLLRLDHALQPDGRAADRPRRLRERAQAA